MAVLVGDNEGRSFVRLGCKYKDKWQALTARMLEVTYYSPQLRTRPSNSQRYRGTQTGAMLVKANHGVPATYTGFARVLMLCDDPLELFDVSPSQPHSLHFVSGEPSDGM